VLLLDRARSLWGPWWPLPAGLPLAYVLAVAAAGDFRPEHGVIVLVSGALAYGSERTKRFFQYAVPYLMVAIGYDAVRYVRPLMVGPDDVLGCGLRSAELVFFRVAPDVTYQDWFAAHHHAVFDLLFAVPYLIFAYVPFAYALYLYFVDRPRMQHFLWAFAVGNFISFTTWMLVPAAPPWYLRAHGCTIDLSAVPSPAALSRVDTLLGMTYFHDFYSRASSVFGALPSMHCAFPLIGLLTAWRAAGWRTRPIHIAYTVVMATAAVYLDHHWVLDVLAGWLVALIAVFLAAWGLRRYGELQRREPVAEDEGPGETETLEPQEDPAA
jgi:membrane-associated phospholipid phosphatase